MKILVINGSPKKEKCILIHRADDKADGLFSVL